MSDRITNAADIIFLYPTEERQEKYRKQFGTTIEKIKIEVEHLKSWLASHPVLPTVEDEKFLERFHSHCKYKIEKTKRKLEVYYKMRATEPNILLNRDPLDPHLIKYKEGLETIVLPLPTADGDRVTIVRVKNVDAEFIDPEAALKLSTMLLDCHMRVELCLNHIIVIDCKGFDTHVLLKLTPGFFNKMDKCLMKAFPPRFAGIHFLNLQPFMHATLNVFQMIMGKKVGSKVVSHVDYESFHKHIPKDVLPPEYGGTCHFTLDQLRDFSYRKIVENRNWFLKESSILADIKKDPNYNNEIFGTKGTFKKIEVD